MRIDLFNDRIIEAPSAETGDSDSGDRPERTIRNIEIHERFVRQTLFQNQASDTNGIPSPGVEIKMFLPLLRHSHRGNTENRSFHRCRDRPGIQHVVAKIHAFIDS